MSNIYLESITLACPDCGAENIYELHDMSGIQECKSCGKEFEWEINISVESIQ